MTKRELNERRLKLIADARALLAKADTEKRDLASDESASYDAMMVEVDQIKAKIDKLEQLDVSQRSADEAAQREQEEQRTRRQIDTQLAQNANRFTPVVCERRSNENARDFADRTRRSQPQYLEAMRSWMLDGTFGEHSRAIQADVDVQGGYLIMPEMFVSELLKFVDNIVFVRQRSRKFSLTQAQSLGVPELSTDIADSDWTSELATGNEDTAMAFGKRALFPHPLAKRIKVSNKLMRLSTLNPEMEVKERMGYKMGVTQEKGFLTGNGANQPLGMFTASASGVSTGRDVTCGTTTAITADGLIDMKYALKWQYQQVAEWVFHRDALKQIRKLKDGVGQYIWQPGLVPGQPDVLLDRPINASEYAPNTFTTGLYVAMLYDPKFYWIAEVNQIAVQKLIELYAETNQTGFIGRVEVDGMPALEEAYSRGKLA